MFAYSAYFWSTYNFSFRLKCQPSTDSSSNEVYQCKSQIAELTSDELIGISKFYTVSELSTIYTIVVIASVKRHKRTKRHVRLSDCFFVRCVCQGRPSYGWTKRDSS